MQINMGNLLPEKTAANRQVQRDRAPCAGQAPKGGNLLPRQGQRELNLIFFGFCTVECNGGVIKSSVKEGVQNGRYRRPPDDQTILGKIPKNDVLAEGNGR